MQTITHRKPVLEDYEIIKLVRNGDINAFERIVERYHRHLLNFIYRMKNK